MSDVDPAERIITLKRSDTSLRIQLSQFDNSGTLTRISRIFKLKSETVYFKDYRNTVFWADEESGKFFQNAAERAMLDTDFSVEGEEIEPASAQPALAQSAMAQQQNTAQRYPRIW